MNQVNMDEQADISSNSMGRGFDVSIVLPCYNEEESVANCVSEALEACKSSGIRAEVVVVDNNSTDGSAALAKEAGARVVSETVPGYGAALRAGIVKAHGSIVVMADADGTYPLDRIPELIAPIQRGEADLCLGGRLAMADRGSMPLLHRFVGTPILSLLLREGTGTTVSDSQSGFRAFRRDTIMELGLSATGMEFASEMLLSASQNHLNIVEIQLGYRTRVGESKLDTWSDGLRHLLLIGKMRPQTLLWHPGIVLLLVGIVVQLLAALGNSTIHIGSAAWQPIFFAPTLQAMGLAMIFIVSLAPYRSLKSPKQLTQAYKWVANRRLQFFARWCGTGALFIGLGIEIALWFGESIGLSVPIDEKITTAGIAQSLILDGILTMGVFWLYLPLIATDAPERGGTDSKGPVCES